MARPEQQVEDGKSGADVSELVVVGVVGAEVVAGAVVLVAASVVETEPGWVFEVV